MSLSGSLNAQHLEADFNAMVPWIPAKVSSILDIGCGMARIDVWLVRHYGDVEVHLMDSDRKILSEGKEQVGFNASTVAWKDRNAGVKTVKKAAPWCRIVGHEPDPSLTIPADLIISLRACGHHFPVETYADLFGRSLRPDGRIILDIRNGTDGVQAMADLGFSLASGNIELRSSKCQRFVFKR